MTTVPNVYDTLSSWGVSELGKVHILYRAIHLLTLLLHCIDDWSADPGAHTDPSATASDEAAKIEFVSFLIDDQSTIRSPTVPLAAADSSDVKLSDRVEAALAGTHSGHNSEEGKEMRALQPTVLGALLDLTTAVVAEDANFGHWIQWTVDRCIQLDERCTQYIQKRVRIMTGDEEGERQKSVDMKKKRARLRAMKAVQSSASTFSAHMNMDIVDEEGQSTAGGAPTPVVAGMLLYILYNVAIHVVSTNHCIYNIILTDALTTTAAAMDADDGEGDGDQAKPSYTTSTNDTEDSNTHTNTHTPNEEYSDEQQQCVICLTKRQQSNHSNSSNNILDNLCYFVYTQASNCIYNEDIGNIYMYMCIIMRILCNMHVYNDVYYVLYILVYACIYYIHAVLLCIVCNIEAYIVIEHYMFTISI